MNDQQALPARPVIYYRLIALWVISESMLGGVIHALKLPVSGLLVGSAAVICICLMAWYVPVRGAILRATLVVAVFKMMLSPQAPPPAYIAVFFQGLMGELLFRSRRFYAPVCILFAVLALLESGLQRVLVLTIIYGKDGWQVVNDFINGLTRQRVPTDYVAWVALAYVAIHFFAGLFLGSWLAGLPARITRWRQATGNISMMTATATAVKTQGRRKRHTGFILVWIVLLLVYIQSEVGIGSPLLPSSLALRVLVRSILVVAGWYFIAGPLLKLLLQRWLRRQQTARRKDIEQVAQVLPGMKRLVADSWKQAGGSPWVRLFAWSRLVLVKTLHPDHPAVVILSRPVRTGKTSSLLAWAREREHVKGILTPDAGEGRVFMDLATGERFPMQASDEKDIMPVGRFRFSRAAFARASAMLRQAATGNGWIVIDEIGPLELKGEGFATVLQELLVLPVNSYSLLLVVREGLVEEVKAKFFLQNIRVIPDISYLEEAQGTTA